jgi:hypothetical protein
MQNPKSDDDNFVLPWAEVEIFIRVPGKRTRSLRMAISDYEMTRVMRDRTKEWADYSAHYIAEALCRAVRDVAGN